MPEKPEQDRSQDRPKPDRIDAPEGGTVKPDQGGEAELTEKEERKQGGRNRQTPGPIYDV